MSEFSNRAEIADAQEHIMNKPPAHYDVGSMLLHWSIALLIACASLSSFFLNNAPTQSFTTVFRTFHYVTGALAFGLFIVWFGWRRFHSELPKLPTIGSSEQRFMDFTNTAMNVLLLLVPVTGVFYYFSLENGIDLGAFKFYYTFGLNQQNLDWAGLAHNLLGKFLLALAFLHSGHALWHHFVRKNDYVRRIIP